MDVPDRRPRRIIEYRVEASLAMQHVRFPDGHTCPALGLGTLAHGRKRSVSGRAKWRALRLALEIGYRVIDTAEMYGEGGAEEVVGRRSPSAARRQRRGARRGVRGQQGLPAQRQPHRRAHGLRAQPPAPQAGSHRPLPAALARFGIRWPKRWPASRRCCAGATSRAGASATSTSTTWRNWPTCGGSRPARPTRSTTRSASAAPAMRCCPGCSARACPDGYCPIDQGVLAANARLAEPQRAKGASAAQLALAWAMQSRAV